VEISDVSEYKTRVIVYSSVEIVRKYREV